jgi:hypothetical protein
MNPARAAAERSIRSVAASEPKRIEMIREPSIINKRLL